MPRDTVSRTANVGTVETNGLKDILRNIEWGHLIVVIDASKYNLDSCSRSSPIDT